MKKLLITLGLISQSAFAAPALDCSNVDLTGTWADNYNQSSIQVSSEKGDLKGVDTFINTQWGKTTVRRVSYDIEFDQTSCVIIQLITKVVEISDDQPNVEKDITATDKADKVTYFKVLENTSLAGEQKLVVAPCKDAACKDLKDSRTADLFRKSK